MSEAMVTNEELRLPQDYSRRIAENDYFVDLPSSLAEGVWQPDIYPFAAALSRRLGVRRLVDLGCGSGEKLAALSETFETIGVDYDLNLASARTTFPHLAWMDQDLEAELSPLNPYLPGSLVICSDVIEHLQNPIPLLRFLRESLDVVYGIVLSTPERHRARGAHDLGPPANPAHTMEWSLEEFGRLLEDNGLHPLLHGFTRNFSEASSRNTQVAFIPGRRSGLRAPEEVPTALAFLPCYNEIDVVRDTIDNLLLQGIEVHVLDNWSSDGTWELLCDAYSMCGEVTLERFPGRPVAEFSWESILERIDSLAAASEHDWILHVDADEQLEAVIPGLGVLGVLAMADQADFDVVDCTLIDFRPEAGGDFTGLPNRWQFASRPGARTLERAWRNRRARVGIAETGGHAISTPKRVFPLNLILRHYPLRSPEQARRKIFADRLPRFGLEKAVKGWHVQYDAYRQDSDFLWSHDALNDWGESTRREWVVEFSTRVGIEFRDDALPPGLTQGALSGVANTPDGQACVAAARVPSEPQSQSSQRAPGAPYQKVQGHHMQAGFSGPEHQSQPSGAVEVIGEGVEYLDGAEGELLDVMAEVSDRSSGSDELSARIHDWPTKYHLSPQRENLLLPISFHRGMSVLDVGCGTGALTRKIAESGATVVGLEGSYARAQVAAARLDGLPNARIMAGSLTDYVDKRPSGAPDHFDVIVVCGVLEYSGSGSGGAQGPQQMLRQVRQLLKPTGSLLLAIENRWGLKYLLSYPEDHLAQPWVGVEGYWRDNSGVRTWSQEALSEMLRGTEFGEQSWFAAYPDYKLPACLVHESMFQDGDGRALAKQFIRSPTTEDAGAPLATTDSMAALQSAIDSGLGMALANSFVVVCGSPGNLASNSVAAQILTGIPPRARAWRSARALTRDEHGWHLQPLGSQGPSISWPLRYRPSDVPVVVGVNAEDLIAKELASGGISSTRLKDLLERWWVEAQAVIPCENGTSTQFDPLPSNFIIDDAGAWHFVDPEFLWHEPLDPTMVALRSLAWTAQRVSRRTGFIQGIASGASVMSVAEVLCHVAGIPVEPGTRSALLSFESVLQAKVAGQEDEAHVAEVRRQLEASLLVPVSAHARTLPFLSLRLVAEHASRELERTQAELERIQSERESEQVIGQELTAALDAMEARTVQAERQLAEVFASRRWRYAEIIRHPWRVTRRAI